MRDAACDYLVVHPNVWADSDGGGAFPQRPDIGVRAKKIPRSPPQTLVMSANDGAEHDRHLARAGRLAHGLLLVIADEISASISLFALRTRRRVLRMSTKAREGGK
jgi:hypothetical protein